MKAILALEDGTLFHGHTFTGEGCAGGEVIFNTGMTGYQEVLTDPSYTGQMVCMGFSRDKATDIASGLIEGTAKLAAESGKHPSVLREMVTSPAGTTIEALMPLAERAARGITGALVRLSVGLESASDLMDDLEQALKKTGK